MMIRTTVCVLGVTVLAAATSVSAQSNWPQFRGDAAGVVADDPALPDSWGLNSRLVRTSPMVR